MEADTIINYYNFWIISDLTMWLIKLDLWQLVSKTWGIPENNLREVKTQRTECEGTNGERK